MSAPSLHGLLVSHWSIGPTVAVPALGAAALYLLAVRRTRDRWPARRTIAFLAGIACVVVALASGIDSYDDRLLSIHMWQHMVLLLVAPPLMLAGRPAILALRALPPQRRGAVARVMARAGRLTAPLPALALLAAVVILTHLPAFYEATLRHPLLHDAEHVLYVMGGLIMFSPLLDGDPAPRHRLSGLGKLGYLIAAMMPMALIGAYLNRHATLAYPLYGAPAHALGVSAVDDQAQAGAIMWVAGGVIMTAIGLWAVLAAMIAEERRQAARDAREVALASPDGSSPA